MVQLGALGIYHGLLEFRMRRSALVWLLLLVAFPARSALVSRDMLTPNDGLLTDDTESGLEWLDVTATQGQSYNSVAAGFGGYVGLGFRYATINEVSTLYTHAGVVHQQAGGFGENAAGALLLVKLMGCTLNCFIGEESQSGIAEDVPFSTTTIRTPYVAISSDRTLGFSVLLSLPGPKSQAYQEAGSYLVRPIPEPSPSLLLGLGLSAFAALARSNRLSE